LPKTKPGGKLPAFLLRSLALKTQVLYANLAIMKSILLVSSLCLLLFLSGCSNRAKPIALDISKGVVTMKGLKLTQTSEGKLAFQIDADEANIYQNESLIKFYKVKAKYFSLGKEVSSLISDEGLLNTTTNDVQASGHVLLKSSEGSILETEQLNWVNKGGGVYTDKAVKVTKGGNIMTGIGLKTDMALEDIKIQKVTTRITNLETLKEKRARK